MKTASEMLIGERSTIQCVNYKGKDGLRLRELGFREGGVITHLYTAPSGSTIAFEVRRVVLALRKEDASRIIVT